MRPTAALAVLAMLALAGCASRAPAPVVDGKPATRVEAAKPTRAAAPAEKLYTVKKGDTLHIIALDHGVDYRDLAAWNNIENLNRIHVGQQLRLSPPGAAPAIPVAEGTEIRPIAQDGAVVARALDAAPLSSVPPAPTSDSGIPPAQTVAPDSETLKRSPKGGKLPYSEQNLARLKAQDAAAVPVAAVAAQPEKTAPEKSVPPPPQSNGTPEGEIDWAWPAPGKLIATFADAPGEGANKGVDIAGRIGDPVQAAAAGKVVYVGNGLRGYGNLVIVRHNASYLTAYAHNSQILVKEGQAVVRGQKIAELGNSDADQPKLHFEVRQLGKPVDPLKFLPPR